MGDLSGRYTQSKCKVSGEVKVLESGYKSHAKTARRNGKGKMRLLLIRIINASKTCDVGAEKKKKRCVIARRKDKNKMRLLLIRIINASKTCDVGRRKGEVQKYTQFD